MVPYKNEHSVWFVVGSQHLYGQETLKKVGENATEIAGFFNQTISVPVNIVLKSIITTAESVRGICQTAMADNSCIGMIFWMHTFSPAQMWITGLSILKKPFLHLHTQYNLDIPWKEIDMDFMNLNQSAHGDREFGFICSRMGLNRAVVVGHWKDKEVIREIEDWSRAAIGWNESKNLRIARIGDNMRDVAVTEGDKVAGHIKFGWTVAGYGVGELVSIVKAVSEIDCHRRMEEYNETYKLDALFKKDESRRQKLIEAARIEIGLEQFLENGNFKAFTTTFEDLHGLKQLPGLSVQRLMAKGYGFGAEGDWKTAALIRCMKVMTKDLSGGTSFMEDYTYHLNSSGMKVLGAHMLEICPSISSGIPTLEVHPLSIGGKDDPARLVFSAKEGDALNASLIDLGDRFRLIVNTVKAVKPENLPKLPVARALWIPNPDLKVAAHAWILAGGAHHTGFSYDVKPKHLRHFAEMAGIEFLLIDENSQIEEFKKEIRWNNRIFS